MTKSFNVNVAPAYKRDDNGSRHCHQAIRKNKTAFVLYFYFLYLMSRGPTGVNRQNATHNGTKCSRRSTIEHLEIAGVMLC